MSHNFQAVRLGSSSTLPKSHIRSEQPNVEESNNLHEISKQDQDKLKIGFKFSV
jgi:hypothetical protein